MTDILNDVNEPTLYVLLLLLQQAAQYGLSKSVDEIKHVLDNIQLPRIVDDIPTNDQYNQLRIDCDLRYARKLFFNSISKSNELHSTIDTAIEALKIWSMVFNESDSDSLIFNTKLLLLTQFMVSQVDLEHQDYTALLDE